MPDSSQSPAAFPGFNGNRRVPLPVNEPVRSYAPGSPERAALKDRLASMSGERIDIPAIIGGREVRSGDLAQSVMPHNHRHVLADWHKAAAADVDAAQARYEEAAALYRGRVRQAMREVEEALVNLQSTAARSEDARVAAEGYRASFSGTEALYTNGLASLVDLEDSRRTQLAAETALLTLQRERASAWVALYRAMGGGWSRDLEGPGGPAVVTGSPSRQP